MSEKQKEKIIKNLKNKEDKIKDYPIFQDWLSDRDLNKKQASYVELYDLFVP